MILEFDRAWERVTGSSVSEMRITDIMWFYDILEEYLNKQLLSDVERKFLIEVIMDCPDTSVDKTKFKAFMERLFECSMDAILQGYLVSNHDNKEEYTRTLTLKSDTLNNVLQRGSVNERKRSLQSRIKELERMVSRAQGIDKKDEKTLSVLNQVLLNYYRSLVSLTETQPETENSLTTIERLKSGIERQDMLVNELKRKVGDTIPSGAWGRIKYSLVRLYYILLSVLRYGIGAVVFLLLIQVIMSFYSVDYGDDYEDDVIW